MRKLLVSVLLTLVSTTLILAQTSRGTVSGSIKDPNGAVVPGVTVILVNTATTVERSATTNNEGFYRFDAVDLGSYSVKISATGFGTVTKTGIIVNANQTSTVDADLAIGSGETVVDVVADSGAQLQTEAPVRGGNVSQKQITELPFADNPVALALTLPGVSSNRGGLGIGTFSVNGARSRSNNFLIDGTENNDISVAGQGFQITNADAVQEVSVQTGNYDSEFGRAGGGVVNVITKPGTSEFHGTLAFEYDSSADDAITAAGSRNPAIIARGRNLSNTQYIPAATLGGPLFFPIFGEGTPFFTKDRNKNFFFVAYQETRFRQPGGTVTLIVPTAAGRARLQPFAATNPNVANYLNATANTIAPIANRPSVSLDDQSLPAAQQTRGLVEIGQFFRTFSTEFIGKQFQIRTDHSISERDQLSFRFLSDKQDQPLGGEVGFEGFDVDYSAKYYNFLVSETHVFSSTTTNEIRLAYNRIAYSFPFAQSGISETLPLFSPGGGLTSLGVGTALPQGRIANNYQVQDTVTRVFGNHTIRVGVDYLRQISTQIAPANIRGTVTYGSSANYTALGNFVDNFGGNGTVSRFFGNATYFPSLHRIAGFAQDRWKASESLTLTMGLRYEYFGKPFATLRSPAFTGLFNVDPTNRTGVFSQPNEVPGDKNNFAPSIGFAFSPSYSSGIRGIIFGEKKSVIRGGYNLGYDSFFNNIASNAAVSSPNGVVTTVNSILATATPRGLANFSNQFPANAAPITALSAQTALLAPDLVNPYYQRWSLGMQRELPLNIIMDISYVGSKGTKLYGTEDGNPQVPLALRRTPAGYPTVCTIGGTVTAAQATSQFPAGSLCPLSGRLDNIQGQRSFRGNVGASSYHSGQLEVRRRFTNNFQVTGAYTFSKSISNLDDPFGIGVGSVTGNSARPVVLGGERLDRAVSVFDRTHRASITYVAQSPLFTKQEGFVGKLLGGFQLSGVTTFETGVPYTIFNGPDSDGIGGGLERPNYNPNGQRGVRAVPIVNAQNFIVSYFNPELVTATIPTTSPLAAIDPSTAQFIVNPAFVDGAAGSVSRFGSLGRNTERSNGINNFDVTVLKRTKVKESVFIETRAEFFNAFNHPQFGAGGNVASTVSNGIFLQPINPTTSGGGRVIRYQVKLIF